MSAPQTLVVATDFGPSADAALDRAIELARKLKARIFLVHTYQLPIVGFPDGALVASAELISRILDGAQTAFARALESRKDCGVEIKTILKQADPREGILEVANEVQADLIVVGTHGRRGIARALIGSVAESIVRTSSVPVMTVHAA
jgi:nucleotide-binding universal stress UspA family protein